MKIETEEEYLKACEDLRFLRSTDLQPLKIVDEQIRKLMSAIDEYDKQLHKKLVITSRTEASEFESLENFPIYEARHIRIDENGLQDLNDLCNTSEYEKLFTKWLELNIPIKTYKVVKFRYPYFGKQEKVLTNDVEIEKTQCNHPFRLGAILDCKVDDELMICEILE